MPVIELLGGIGALASVGSFLLEAVPFGLAFKADLTKLDSIFAAAQEELMDSKRIMNEYFLVLGEREREGFYDEYNVYVRL